MKKERKQDEKKYGCIHPPPVHRPLRWGYSACFLDKKLVGCLRILSDGYYFGTITELLVLPQYQKQGIGRELMQRAVDISPTTLFFGAQPEAEGFYEKLKIEKSLQSFCINKPINVTD